MLSAGAPLDSADGKWLFYLAGELGTNRQDFVAVHYGVYVAPMEDPLAARRLTDERTMDLRETGDRLERIGDDGVLALDRTRGAMNLVRISASGHVEVLVDGPRLVTGAGAAGETVVVSCTDASSAGDVAVLAGGALRTLTDFSADFRAAAGVISAREVTHTAPDGYPVHGWVLLPEGDGPHPVLLNIHGGPFAQYGWGLFDEAQVYAEAGYAVLMCNPRGAAGYGYDHARSIKEAMGTVDLDDVLAFLDGALASDPSLDAGKLGIMGGSYGGYLTAWTISQDHRFTAAIVERGYLDPPSFIGSSDIGWFFSNEYTGTEPEAVRAQNPMAQVDKVSTPTLVIHSEEDLRCPLEQAHRYYTALKMRGVETELLVFPGENHELSRSGTPHHRRQRFEHILRWWAQHLPTGKNPAPAGAAD
ncbi:alpha/beta hydrolase family protein [Paenarthrobacter sp. Z7-10]|uniref:alpha/beta hydrolase family protein n=1 Tax=Paenarthrobacter sp. Z7-10 TaxID=2787635 RepID=UPI002E78DBED|nr:S9 family peptidase [Paenarthrobacter sp. Z7-10]